MAKKPCIVKDVDFSPDGYFTKLLARNCAWNARLRDSSENTKNLIIAGVFDALHLMKFRSGVNCFFVKDVNNTCSCITNLSEALVNIKLARYTALMYSDCTANVHPVYSDCTISKECLSLNFGAQKTTQNVGNQQTNPLNQQSPQNQSDTSSLNKTNNKKEEKDGAMKQKYSDSSSNAEQPQSCYYPFKEETDELVLDEACRKKYAASTTSFSSGCSCDYEERILLAVGDIHAAWLRKGVNPPLEEQGRNKRNIEEAIRPYYQQLPLDYAIVSSLASDANDFTVYLQKIIDALKQKAESERQ